jgi:hypothetical protein
MRNPTRTFLFVVFAAFTLTGCPWCVPAPPGSPRRMMQLDAPVPGMNVSTPEQAAAATAR